MQRLLTWPRLTTAFAMLGGLLLLIVLRLHTYDEPVERDIAIHAIIGNEWLNGRALYSDLWNHKPPASFLIHAGFNALFGFSPDYVQVMNLFFNSLSLLGIVGLSRAMGASWLTAASAAPLWALLSFDLALQANQPNSEALANPMLVGGMLIWYLLAEQRLHPAWTIVAGLLFFVASFLKQHYALLPIALALAFILHAALFTRAQLARQCRLALQIGAVGVIGWGLACLVFWLQGSLRDFVEAAFFYNKGYGGDWLLNLKRSYWKGILPPPTTIGLYVYAAATVLGLLCMLAQRQWKTFLVLAAWVAATFLMVALPGQFFPHYYQLWMPVLLVGSALLLSSIQSMKLITESQALAVGVFGLLLAFSSIRASQDLMLRPPEWTARKYPRENFVEARAVGEALQRLLPAGAVVFYWGADPEVLFYGRFRSAGGKLYTAWFSGNDHSPKLLADTVARFHHQDFTVAVINQDPGQVGAASVTARLHRDFVAVPECFPNNTVWVRQDSPLLARLKRRLAEHSYHELNRLGIAVPPCQAGPEVTLEGGDPLE